MKWRRAVPQRKARALLLEEGRRVEKHLKTTTKHFATSHSLDLQRPHHFTYLVFKAHLSGFPGGGRSLPPSSPQQAEVARRWLSVRRRTQARLLADPPLSCG